MTAVRPFRAADLFAFNDVNMDHWTETYSNGFYLNYLAQWPDMALTANAPHTDTIVGYVLGKAEGREPRTERALLRGRRAGPPTLHGHVTAVTVAPAYRRLGVAQMLMDFFEHVSAKVYSGYFVDLFVRPSNRTAIGMYEKRGYSVYRRVHAYYRGADPTQVEDGYGAPQHMRKPLPRDAKQETVRAHGRSVVVQPEYVRGGQCAWADGRATLFEPLVHSGV
ncbi:N-terminal methionine N(alpha)-acetyltransferase NatB [Malassezia sp. CBS 17886]|nr:N-terminal methionine N(alpha)-acetyltransferase NatB [Malassezia sp. CBS 17886]